jgi:hypothetical protein
MELSGGIILPVLKRFSDPLSHIEPLPSFGGGVSELMADHVARSDYFR